MVWVLGFWDGFGVLLNDEWFTLFLTLNSFGWLDFCGVGAWIWHVFGMLLNDELEHHFSTLNSLGWLGFSDAGAWIWDGFGILLNDGWIQAG